MIALIDILAKKDDAEALIFVIGIAVVGVVIALISAAQKRKQAQARMPRPVQRQTQRRQAPPQVQAPPPAHSSTSEEGVAKQLAPEMVSMMHARNLTPQVEKVAAAKFSLITLLKDKRDVRRALILNEVLGKPVALRRK